MILQTVFLVRKPGEGVCIRAEYDFSVSCNIRPVWLFLLGSQNQEIMQEECGSYFVVCSNLVCFLCL